MGRPCAAGLATALWLAAVLGGCSLAPPPVVPESVADHPDGYGQAAVDGPYRPLGWWAVYQDPVLDELVALALTGSPELDEAVARVEQARARLRIERAGLIPDLAAELRASRQNQPATGITELGGPPGGGQLPPLGGRDDRIVFDDYSASLQLAYELDFWGRVRNSARAAEARLDASVGDLQTALLSVIAETLRAYFDIVFLEQRLDLARQNVALLRERAQLTEQRYLRGLTNSFELYSIRGRLRTAEASVPRLGSRLYAAQARLAVTLGGYPQRVVALLRKAAPLTLTVPLEPVPPGLPSSLLIQRPDVRAAWLRLEAQRFELGARRAERFPQVTLNAAGGLQADDPSRLVDLDNWFRRFAAGATAPLITGGRVAGQVTAAEAALAAQAAAYARTVLTAFQEVETALESLDANVTRYRLLQRELDTAGASAELQLRRYTRGVGDYLAYLDARRNLVDARAAVLAAERDLAEARLTVHRALGGTWVEEDLGQRGRALLEAVRGGSSRPTAGAGARRD